jgi:D-hexose-6-phosphate mutarotase
MLLFKKVEVSFEAQNKNSKFLKMNKCFRRYLETKNVENVIIS